MAKKYIDADLLKKEIKRLKEEYTDIAIDNQMGWVNANSVIDDLEQLQSQIDSLQQEQLEVDLEKEIDACWQNWLSPSNQKEVEGVLPKTEFATYARHFYKLGLNARKEEQK